MYQTHLFRFGIVTSVILLFMALLQANLWAAQSEESALEKSGTRTVESGPSLSSMEKESGSGGWSYNSEYIFGISKAVRDSSMPPGAKVVVAVFTLPLDVVLLPFAALLGLLGE
jgi:hypothetical protein